MKFLAHCPYPETVESAHPFLAAALGSHKLCTQEELAQLAELELVTWPHFAQIKLLDQSNVGLASTKAREMFGRDPSDANRHLFQVLGDGLKAKLAAKQMRGALHAGVTKLVREKVVPTVEPILTRALEQLEDEFKYQHAAYMEACENLRITETFGSEIVWGAKSLSPGHSPQMPNEGAILNAYRRQIVNLRCRIEGLRGVSNASASGLLDGVVWFEQAAPSPSDATSLEELATLLAPYTAAEAAEVTVIDASVVHHTPLRGGETIHDMNVRLAGERRQPVPEAPRTPAAPRPVVETTRAGLIGSSGVGDHSFKEFGPALDGANETASAG